MKKGVIIILAVAIIGGLGVYTKAHDSSAKANENVGAESSNDTIITTPAANSVASNNSTKTAPGYKDGKFTGSLVDTIYGPVQVRVAISGGKIVDVIFLNMPDEHGHTQEVTDESSPILKRMTLTRQSADLDFVSGATQTSEGYIKSLQAALNQAV